MGPFDKSFSTKPVINYKKRSNLRKTWPLQGFTMLEKSCIILIFVGILLLSPTMHGRKIPGIIKKINKALGLFVKSEQLWDIFPDIEKLQYTNDTLSAQIAANKAG